MRTFLTTRTIVLLGVKEVNVMGKTDLAIEIQNELAHVRKSGSSRYGLNNIHSYPAKMLINISSVVISKFTKPGDLILDPFCGSGTVLLDSKMKSRNAIGIDINPLAVLISNVKTRNLASKKIDIMKDKILRNASKKLSRKTNIKVEIPNIDYWFTSSAKKQLTVLLNEILKIKEKKYREFFLVCFSSCIRRASRADPEIIPPVISKKMRLILSKKRTNSVKQFKNTVEINSKRISILKHKKKSTTTRAYIGDARCTKIPTNHIDFVLTSPPYISAQKYPRSLKLELFWTGLTDKNQFMYLDKHTIGTERVSLLSKNMEMSDITDTLNNFLKKIQTKNSERYVITRKYFTDMRQVISEIHRVLKPDGHFVLLIGENTVCGLKAPSAKILTEFCQQQGFRIVAEVEDTIRSFGFMTRRNKTAGIIKKEKILIFKKGKEHENKESI